MATTSGDTVRIATPPAASRLRVHTPPAPRWGARDDNWAPFTPRRSSRVAAQRHVSPISPESPTRISKKPVTVERLRKTRRVTPTSSASEDEQQLQLQQLHGAGVTRERALAPSDSQANALPTPAKTPRTKRPLSKEVLGSASRVLFHGRLANVDDAMPSLRKVRKGKAFSLNPFVDDASATSASKIEVYEDSKDRVPTANQDEDNPFLSKSNVPQRATSARAKRQTERDARMEEAVRKEEGLIYVFRGKKILKKFSDGPESEGEDDNLSDQELRRRAGVSPTPRAGRGIKPRILFPNEDQRKAREAAAEDADEEALTDIEVPLPSSNKQTSLDGGQAQPSLNNGAQLMDATTSNEAAEQIFSDPNTLPPQSTESSADNHAHPSSAELPPPASQTSETSDINNKHLSNTRKPRASSPFDKWSRTKPSVAAPSAQVKSRKRGASPMEQPTKRVRSDARS